MEGLPNRIFAPCVRIMTPWSGVEHPVGEEGFTGRAAIGYDHGYDGGSSTSG